MFHKARSFILTVALLLISAVLFPQDQILKLAATTSTENSGLLDAILPRFEALFGGRVDIIAVGTGRALKYGETGDVDCVLVHSKSAEDSFIQRGYGINQQLIMYNSFVIVGPGEDPADVRSARTAPIAMVRIATSGQRHSSTRRQSIVRFISRGDDSGTHDKEKILWDETISFPIRGWYLEAGQGMAQVLVIASEMSAYTLSDRGTFIALKERLDLVELFDSDPLFHNPYSVIAVNPSIHPHVNSEAASAFITWLISPECQELIDGFRLNGEQLFYPHVSEKR